MSPPGLQKRVSAVMGIRDLTDLLQPARGPGFGWGFLFVQDPRSCQGVQATSWHRLLVQKADRINSPHGDVSGALEQRS
jgi:hypothetical protein